MSHVYLPRHIGNAVEEEQRQIREEVNFLSGRLNYYDGLVRAIDEHLRVVLAKENTTVEGLKAGYYHLVRLRPGHPAYIKPYEYDDGSWRDLDSGILDAAIEDDLWNDQVIAERKRLRRKAEDAKARDRQRAHEDRAAEIDARIKSLNSTQILVPRSIS
jgi:hypothetical protein